ncbi:hypothetical protein [Xenorhabdus bovienii]|uniref:Odorant binding protein C14 n=1 Tax=Xenorhabdus bovienii str. kraussei Becker Underwood TaxID=1398204 RepID=A0A077PU90_XENBV
MTSLIDIHLEKIEQHLDEENKNNWKVIEGASGEAIAKLLNKVS